MRVDARQAWFPPAGAPHARFSSSFSSNPRPPPPGPCPRPSVCRGQPMALRHGATGRRPRVSRPRAWTPPAPGAQGTEPGGGGCVGSAAPAAASHPWTGGAGCGLARQGRRRASGAGSPEGTCPRDMAWAPGVAGAGSRCALPGEGQGAPPRRTQAERALQDPKASRASAGAVRARPAGRFTRPGRGQAPGQPGEGLPERFSVGAGFAATAPDLDAWAGAAYRACSTTGTPYARAILYACPPAARRPAFDLSLPR